jgi:hypothetical protein
MYAKAIVPRKLPYVIMTVSMYQLVRVEEGTGGGVAVSEVLGYFVHTYSGCSSPFTYTSYACRSPLPLRSHSSLPLLLNFLPPPPPPDLLVHSSDNCSAFIHAVLSEPVPFSLTLLAESPSPPLQFLHSQPIRTVGSVHPSPTRLIQSVTVHLHS